MNVLRRDAVDVTLRTTTDARKLELLKRAGKDPVVIDKRSSAEIMKDEIPYLRWAKEQLVIVRAGYRTWCELLRDRFDAKKRNQT